MWARSAASTVSKSVLGRFRRRWRSRSLPSATNVIVIRPALRLVHYPYSHDASCLMLFGIPTRMAAILQRRMLHYNCYLAVSTRTAKTGHLAPLSPNQRNRQPARVYPTWPCSLWTCPFACQTFRCGTWPFASRVALRLRLRRAL